MTVKSFMGYESIIKEGLVVNEFIDEVKALVDETQIG